MTSLLALRKSYIPTKFHVDYGFLLELWVLNLNEKEEDMKKKRRIVPIVLAKYIYDGEDLGHPYIYKALPCFVIMFVECL